jgi:thymidylate synthase (FAD)
MTPEPLKAIETAGRTCYKSEDKITDNSAIVFTKMLLVRGHDAMIEHASMSYKLVCDRGVSHEIVRHRLFSYAQESTRYCNYKGGVTFIIPPWVDIREGSYTCGQLNNVLDEEDYQWAKGMTASEARYLDLLEHGWSPQQARSVLPNSLKTEIVIAGNLREWRHFFSLRTAAAAHPQMREIASLVLKDAASRIPVIFDEYVEKIEEGEL